ncbi:RNA polymerase sigma factor [Sphingobacterium psychroaquaticum]|uniref:RNA polymerase sigma-70 factor, ECF subfamily n=1 Tax=Sphingobacterium psychroaquaticum TaxID=561061 RepID=A0A1X7LCF4_9SPHI|nr:RNA polymerase sigma-70 factor [Sphingobacterium psychroaquaticum]QBQ40384.1 RNA polymerase sigma-70 factor [Sphingobacterium psychroaquaticum]SMG51237.1 RNA polymerase sigma-70 factor, ECF subfamily [Sphingobacterium psychroaquaticum]
MFKRDSFSSEMEDKEQLLLLRKGNYAAFDTLYRTYSARVLGRLIRLLGSEEVAEELLQELFFRVWEKRSQIDANQSFKGYLFTIARNLAYDYFRKQSVSEHHRQEFIKSYSELYEHVEEDVVFKQTQERLMQSIYQLPPQCQQVYILFKIEGKSYLEISALMGISKSTINNHLTKANSILKKEFPFLCHWVAISLALLWRDY